jgi:hypothetical protein
VLREKLLATVCHPIVLLLRFHQVIQSCGMADTRKNAEKHIEADPLVIPDSFEGYPLSYFK